MIQALGNKVAIKVDISLYDKYGKSNLICNRRVGGEGFNFKETEDYPRIGIVVSVPNQEWVSDEFRRIRMDLKVGDKVIFPHDAIMNNGNVDDVYFADVTRIYGYIREGELHANSDTVFCKKIVQKNQLGVDEVTNAFEIVKVSDPMRYTINGLFNGELDLKVGDCIVYKGNPYVIENANHRLIFDYDLYAIHRFSIISKYG